uniref:Putative secreted protein n=1 Tax=Anopheles marajoara TaxID=58244 RepID=A0A2M4C6T5_9DIPT
MPLRSRRNTRMESLALVAVATTAADSLSRCCCSLPLLVVDVPFDCVAAAAVDCTIAEGCVQDGCGCEGDDWREIGSTSDQPLSRLSESVMSHVSGLHSSTLRLVFVHLPNVSIPSALSTEMYLALACFNSTPCCTNFSSMPLLSLSIILSLVSPPPPLFCDYGVLLLGGDEMFSIKRPMIHGYLLRVAQKGAL